jgi:hypothetical protein
MNGFAAPSRQSVMTLNFALVQFCLSATHMLYITYLTNHLLIFDVRTHSLVCEHDLQSISWPF